MHTSLWKYFVPDTPNQCCYGELNRNKNRGVLLPQSVIVTSMF